MFLKHFVTGWRCDMSVTYFAYLCYPCAYSYEDDTDDDTGNMEPVIKFEKTEEWKYEKILPIQFSILHGWTDKDKGLYP